MKIAIVEFRRGSYASPVLMITDRFNSFDECKKMVLIDKIWTNDYHTIDKPLKFGEVGLIYEKDNEFSCWNINQFGNKYEWIFRVIQ